MVGSMADDCPRFLAGMMFSDPTCSALFALQ